MAKASIRENERLERLLRLFKRGIPPSILDAARPLYHFLLSFFAAFLYRFPARKLLVIGVTGTKGKSTVVELAGEIFRKAGKPVATLSSLAFSLQHDAWPNTLKMTVPGRLKLQKFLREAVSRGCKYLILEMTSEAIKQHRHRFMRFHTAAFTNLHPEHIEAHGSFEAYRNAKGELFRLAREIHILNADDPASEFFGSFPAKRKLFYGFDGSKKELVGGDHLLASDISFTKGGSTFRIGEAVFRTQLIGNFNVSNVLCAVAISRSVGIPWETIRDAVATFPRLPGRLEFVEVGQPFRVVIDFAHTPDSLREVYRTLKALFPGSGLICVLGATGGGRDRWKRPVMGEIASEECKKVFFTNEDPYDEPPERIIDELANGAGRHNFEKVRDRNAAIKRAIRAASPGDTVVITGKGGEQWMVVAGGEKIPWSDTKTTKDALREQDVRI